MGQGSAWEEERCGWELEGDAGLEEGEDLAGEGEALATSRKGEEEAAAWRRGAGWEETRERKGVRREIFLSGAGLAGTIGASLFSSRGALHPTRGAVRLTFFSSRGTVYWWHRLCLRVHEALYVRLDNFYLS